MFSQEPRCIYRNNPLGQVICQLRFPEILSISANPPAQFQEAIRGQFPRYAAKQEQPGPKLTASGGNIQVSQGKPTVNYSFQTQDGVWRVNLTSKFISLTTTRYTCWEEFARWLDQPLASFISVYQPAYFERVGLRYINFISRNRLGLEGVPYRELINSKYLGILADEDVLETGVSRCSMEVEMNLRGGCRAKLHAGPGMVNQNGKQDPEVKFVFDQDLFMPGNVPVNLSAGALQTLHGQAYPIFRSAITQRLHDAMEPEEA